GHWTIVPAPSDGSGRGRVGGRGGGGLTVQFVSGGAVNCGPECTISQNAMTLTIVRPAVKDHTPPDVGTVVLNLDGSDSTITQRRDPPDTYTAKAKWDGDRLVVTREMGPLTVTQMLSLDQGKLKVTSTFVGTEMPPVTMTYTKT
ncbi:MAG TPA: hypothetical protein VJP86_14185, partial [Vicinamibacterales bacterium]|nr:hypothetical protein [Vicinamibacterales bacterium]